MRAGEAYSGVQQGTPSANVAKSVAHLELVLHSMLIMALLVLSIGSVQYIMDLLADVLNAPNESVSPFIFRLNMS